LVDKKVLTTFDLTRQSLNEVYQDIVNKQIKEPNLEEINFDVPEFDLQEEKPTIKVLINPGI